MPDVRHVQSTVQSAILRPTAQDVSQVGMVMCVFVDQTVYRIVHQWTTGVVQMALVRQVV